MSQNDYIILRDEDGKAYIAHAGLLDNARNAISTAAQQVANKAKGVGRGDRQNHKYILKVNENGRTRYFYKQEEAKAYYEAKKRGIKNPAEYAQKAVDAVKNATSKAGNAAKSAFREATGQAARDRMDEAAEKYPEAQKAFYNSADEKNKKQIKYDTAERHLNDAAYDATQAQNKLNQANWLNRYSRTKANQKAQADLASAYDNYNQANRDYSKAETQFAKDRDMYDQVTGDYLKNKRAYNRSIAGVYDKVAPKAKEAANNAVTKAKAQLDRMKEEFRARDQQKTDNNTSYPHSRDKKVGEGSATAKKGEKVDFGGPVGNTNKSADTSRALTGGDVLKSKTSAQEMIDRARTAVKDKSEDLSAKAKSTAQSARDSVKGMIDNARSSTAKAVNEAWDRIPKNSDGTVNPFDKNFQSTYNDWKAKKDKYDSSLAGRAKDAAEKSTDAVQDMIDQAKKVVKGNSGSNLTREQEQTNTGSRQTKRTQEEMNEMRDRQKASKSSYGEYSDNDKDFAEKNYSKNNHVEDTDFYTFKRDDGKWVILEEDMKWVLPEGVTGNDPGVRNALKQFADHASSAKAIGNENYNNDQWVDAVTDAIDKAAENKRKR